MHSGALSYRGRKKSYMHHKSIENDNLFTSSIHDIIPLKINVKTRADFQVKFVKIKVFYPIRSKRLF